MADDITLPGAGIAVETRQQPDGSHRQVVALGDLPVDPQNADTPATTRIVGNPAGDWAGQDLLEALIDPQTGVQMQVAVVNPPKLDANGAAMASDAPSPINISGPVGTNITIDTTGYQSLHISSSSVVAVVIAGDDGVNWTTLSGISRAPGGGWVASISGGTAVIYPCIARYVRITIYSAGTGVAYLRSQPFPVEYMTTAKPVNLSQWGGLAVANAGSAGVPAVGGVAGVGNPASGSANPVMVAGADSTKSATGVSTPLIRRMLTDSTGRVVTADTGIDQTGATYPLGIFAPGSNVQAVAALAVVDVDDHEGQSAIELLGQILTELRIANQYLFELPRLLNAGSQSQDEPGVFRSDSTIFNQ